MMPVPEASPMDPAPVVVRSRWPASRQLVVDAARIGALVGGVALTLVAGSWGWVGIVVGASAGAGLGVVVAPARHRLQLDAEGVHIGRLTGVVHIGWDEVIAFGRDEGWQGRSGRSLGLAVCRRGEVLPVGVPALTYTTSAFRMGGAHPIDRLAPRGEAVLAPVREWALARGVPVVEQDLDVWWDRHPASAAA